MDLQRGLVDILPRVLSKYLEGLQHSEIVSSIVMNPELISVEYKGKKLESVLLSIISWGACCKGLFKRNEGLMI